MVKRRYKTVAGVVNAKSWFYKNCGIQRKRGSKCCLSCPFREGIEELERELKGEVSSDSSR